MIEGLQPYSKTTEKIVRTSTINVPWLTSRPAHWPVVRSKRLFHVRTERARADDEQLSATQAFGVIPQAEFERRVGRKVVRITQHLDKRAHVEPDDFVISMRSFQGGLERAWARGCIRSSYVVLKPSAEVRVGYFAHLFKSQDYIRALQATSNFIRDGQDLNMNNFVLVDLPLPTADEQDAIARFLDHANRKIDGFIRAKRKLIALLGEQKQAIIHRAVTRGLNTNAPLKPSGIPWLGDIPKHWELWPNRASLSIRKVLVGDRHPEFTLLSLTKRGVIVRDLSEMRGKFSSDMGTSQEVRNGDFVFCLFDVPETPRTVGLSNHDGMITGAYTVMECKNRDIAKFLELFYIAMDDQKALSPLYSGLRNTIPKPTFLGVKTPIPPAHERAEILKAVKERTASLDATIARTEREIALMQEYRTRLTADVVTGKLDVRPAAAHLLAEPLAPEPEPEESHEPEEAEA